MRALAWIVAVLLIAGGAALPAGQGGGPADAYLGTWSGEWVSSESSGGLELTLEKGADGRLGGRITAKGEPEYTTDIRSASFEAGTLKAVYDFPPDPAIEVTLSGTFEGKQAKGTWSARTKADGGELAQGTWTLAKK